MALRLDKKDLLKLIESTEAGGHDASHLRAVLATLPQPTQSRQGLSHLREDEELTTSDYLNMRVGELFPEGITDEVLAQLIEMDGRYNLKELQAMCKDAGLSSHGGKKELAAKLLAGGFVENILTEAQMTSSSQKDSVDLARQREWTGKPGTLTIPEAYIKDLQYEIVVFARKERGGSDFTFRCREYEMTTDGQWRFAGVVIDTSIKTASGEVEKVRLSYHPEISLVDIGFMVIPAAEVAET